MHLGVSVTMTRLAFVTATFLWGAGLVAYILLWVAVPSGDPIAAYRAQYANRPQQEPLSRGNHSAFTPNAPDMPYTANTLDDTANSNGAGLDDQGHGLNQGGPFEALRRTIGRASKPALFGLVGLSAMIVSISILASPLSATLIIPVLLAMAGIAVSWFSFDAETGQLRSMILGVVLVAIGFVTFVLIDAHSLRRAEVDLAAAFALLLGVTAVVVPWIIKLINDLGVQRALKEREEERADMTAHLHDGVLQTLALIQLNSEDASTVFTLARSQERELREWLYQERTPSGRSVSTGIKEIAARIEDRSGRPIDVVTVGDARPSSQTDALLNASEQAMLNAVQHGGEPISVYCESGDTQVEVFVRDHGSGFDQNMIPADRLGIRQSIIGRIERHGGSVEIVSRPDWGTEVRMHMPISVKPHKNNIEPSAKPEATTNDTMNTDKN
jgi:signal transduction histidine kinase